MLQEYYLIDKTNGRVINYLTERNLGRSIKQFQAMGYKASYKNVLTQSELTSSKRNKA